MLLHYGMFLRLRKCKTCSAVNCFGECCGFFKNLFGKQHPIPFLVPVCEICAGGSMSPQSLTTNVGQGIRSCMTGSCLYGTDVRSSRAVGGGGLCSPLIVIWKGVVKVQSCFCFPQFASGSC